MSGPHIAFSEVARSGDNVFHVEDLTKRYGDLTLFTNLSFDLPRGKRLGVMGANGCGKTTLLKILLGEEGPTSGLVQRGHLVFPGYLDQHLAILDPEKSVMRAVWPDDDPQHTEQKMRDLLGSFGLHGEIVEHPISSLSGGERSRAALAKLTVNGANLLVLDEPTNHLDIWACDSLEEALKAYEGTCIVVSHDRYFLNRVADLMIVFADDTTEVVYGNYDTYELLRQAREQADKASDKGDPRAQVRGWRGWWRARGGRREAGEAQASVSVPQGAGPGSRHRRDRSEDHRVGGGTSNGRRVQGCDPPPRHNDRFGEVEGRAGPAVPALGRSSRIERLMNLEVRDVTRPNSEHASRKQRPPRRQR